MSRIGEIRARLRALCADMGGGSLQYGETPDEELHVDAPGKPRRYVNTTGGPSDAYAAFFKHAPDDIAFLLERLPEEGEDDG